MKNLHQDVRGELAALCLRFFILAVMLLILVIAGVLLSHETVATTFAGSHVARQSEPKDVVDYFLHMPTKYFGDMFTGRDRVKLIKIKDTKNGYLRIEGAWEGYAEMALFRQTDGTALVGFTAVTFGPAPEQKIYFLHYDGREWRDRTAGVFRKVPDAALSAAYRRGKSAEDDDYRGEVVPHVYLLPRYDTTLRVVTAPGFAAREFTLAELRYSGGRFEVRAPSTPPDFEGEWGADNKSVSFTLTITRDKNELTGSYTYITLPNAARIREGRIEGVVRGGVGELRFEGAEDAQERGAARITLKGQRLLWEIAEPPGGGSRMPFGMELYRTRKRAPRDE